MTTDKDQSMDDQSPAVVFAVKGIDVTPNKDEGVRKVVKKQGEDGDRPMIGDKVAVHYTGKLLNGKKFDSSMDRKKPFIFNLGKGQVIKGLDIGVSSMQRGEVCMLLCKPEYAYGSAGCPPKIPPNAMLQFEVELLSFKGEVLTDDGGITRRIKVKGEGYNSPNDGSTVHVHLEGRCGERLFDSRNVHFVVGESEDMGVPLGVDRAMEKMQKGECCMLYLKPKYGFGKDGRAQHKIGPNSDLMYEVTLNDFEKAKESWELDLKEKLDLSARAKQKGTQYFKAGCFLQAVVQYQRIVSLLEMEFGVGKEQQQMIQDFLLVAQLNLAMCYLRLREYALVVENCNKVIELDGKNEKALYRRGEARLFRNEFSLAMSDFKLVLQVNPSNRAAHGQVSICQRKIREHHERDKKIYANMFQKFAEHDVKAGKGKRRRGEDNGAMNENHQVAIKRRRRSQDHGQDCP
ncbi:peptidyl-prolyl cis-trans isomerase FKBP5-like [Salvelinus namaycush]|uniref:peptidylprolyl isomerase n=1 Tax=Salvelinus namaycush TaxID=8040 RepID=A0A8U1H5Z3_SALNM|nr:peptidyl-prolyl cis-trans isomerase FKBP5-like [Salvelinus namaycush]